MKYLLLLTLCVGCSKSEEKATPKVAVKVGQVIEKTVPYHIDTVGNVLANNLVQVTPQATGQVVEIHVKEGQMVKAGDLLYVIDPRPYQASLVQAQGALEKDVATLEYAKNQLQRYLKLVPGNFVAPLTIEQYESNVKAAEGQVKQDEGALETARINLDYCYVKSPVEGKISQYNINLGNVVTANDTNALTTLRQLQPIQIQFSYAQRDFEKIMQSWNDKTFTFECSLYNDKERSFTGDVYFIDNSINTNTGAIIFKGLYPNENLELWPGAFIRVKMFVKTLENAVLVPLIAVEKGSKGFSVFVVDTNNVVELRAIEIGPQIDDNYVVYSGLKPGETVVTVGQLNLRPGTEVEIKQ